MLFRPTPELLVEMYLRGMGPTLVKTAALTGVPIELLYAEMRRRFDEADLADLAG